MRNKIVIVPAKKEAKKRKGNSTANSFRSLWAKLHDSPAYKLLNDVSLLIFVLGSIGALYTGIRGAVTHKPPLEILQHAAVPLALAAILFEIWTLRTKARRIFGATLLSGIAATIAVAWWLSSIRVYQPFAEAARKYSTELGKPASVARPIRRVTLQRYDHDTHIWLGVSGGGQSWFLLHDGTFITRTFPNYPDDPDIYDFSKLRTRFPDVPPSRLPPYGGAAIELSNNPQIWGGLLKWMQWQCVYNYNSIVEQEFTNGMIVGGFNVSPTDTSKEVVYVFFNDKWQMEDLNSSPPPCERSMKASEQ
jgi:hypothetical protein